LHVERIFWDFRFSPGAICLPAACSPEVASDFLSFWLIKTGYKVTNDSDQAGYCKIAKSVRASDCAGKECARKICAFGHCELRYNLKLIFKIFFIEMLDN
jgi:hypothetical protein